MLDGPWYIYWVSYYLPRAISSRLNPLHLNWICFRRPKARILGKQRARRRLKNMNLMARRVEHGRRRGLLDPFFRASEVPGCQKVEWIHSSLRVSLPSLLAARMFSKWGRSANICITNYTRRETSMRRCAFLYATSFAVISLRRGEVQINTK